MKKIKQTFILMIAASTLFACKKTNFATDIVGQWNYDLISTITRDGDDVSIHDEEYEHLCETEKDYLLFSADGNFKSVEYNTECNGNENAGNWLISGDKVTISYNNVVSLEGTIAMLEDGRLIIRDDGASTSTEEILHEFVYVGNN